MPVLNGMPWLPLALESIVHQTAGVFPLLVWDNGSTDGTLEVLREWIPNRIPGRVFSGESLSLGMSLRRLVQECSAPLCARMDADDINMPERLAVEIDFLNKHPEVALVGTCVECIDAEGLPTAKVFNYPQEWIDIRHATINAPRFPHPSALFRRDEILAVGNYADHSTSSMPYWSEDYDLWLRLLAVKPAHILQERMLKYRINPMGLSQSEIKKGRAAKARLSAWVKNAPVFAGITDPVVAAQLFKRQLAFAAPEIFRIARHFSLTDGLSFLDRLSRPSFVAAADRLVNKHDLLTRTFLKLCWMRMKASLDFEKATKWDRSLLQTA